MPKDYQAPEDLEDRLILPMLNEAVSCLHDGVVADADLLDAGVIFGTGFAPFRGGPMQHIKAVGADKLKARLDVLANRYGGRFKPARGLGLAVSRAACLALGLALAGLGGNAQADAKARQPLAMVHVTDEGCVAGRPSRTAWSGWTTSAPPTACT